MIQELIAEALYEILKKEYPEYTEEYKVYKKDLIKQVERNLEAQKRVREIINANNLSEEFVNQCSSLKELLETHD